MALIVEDGSGVAGANSYLSLAEIRDYAAARGVTLSDDDAVVSAQAILAMDYLDAREAQFQGVRSSPAQSLSWPRRGVMSGGTLLSPVLVPNDIRFAQARLVIAQSKGVDIFPNRVGGKFVKEKTVGPLTTVYSETVGISVEPTMTAVDALLRPYLSTTGGFGLTVVRV